LQRAQRNPKGKSLQDLLRRDRVRMTAHGIFNGE
jgi:hypothetical protein